MWWAGHPGIGRMVALPVCSTALGKGKGGLKMKAHFLLYDMTWTVSSFYYWCSKAFEEKADWAREKHFTHLLLLFRTSLGFTGQCQVDYYSFLQWKRGRHFLLKREIFLKSKEMKRIKKRLNFSFDIFCYIDIFCGIWLEVRLFLFYFVYICLNTNQALYFKLFLLCVFFFLLYRGMSLQENTKSLLFGSWLKYNLKKDVCYSPLFKKFYTWNICTPEEK